MDILRGRLCGLIESFNLNDKHEQAAISTLKALSYDLQLNLANILAHSAK